MSAVETKSQWSEVFDKAAGKPADRTERATPRDDGYTITAERLLEMFPGSDLPTARKKLRNMLADMRDYRPNYGPTERPANVRPAIEKDEGAINELLMLDLKEAGADRIAPIDPGKIMDHIQAGTRMKGGVVGVIDDDGGKPIATVCLIPCQWWWSQGYYLQDIWSYVHPDFRSGNNARNLIQFACWIGDTWTVEFGYRVHVLTGVLGTKRAREKFGLFRRMVSQVGIACLYPAPPGS